MKKFIIFVLVIFLIVIALVVILRKALNQDHTVGVETKTGEETLDATYVANNLHTPWEIVFLPNGEQLVTQRNGTLTIVREENSIDISVPGVVEKGEGGLLGLAIHPNFSVNNFIYLYFTTTKGDDTVNRVVRYVFGGNQIKEDKVIVDNIPGNNYHNGGRIAFGPDGYLYITTGDSQDESIAQDTKSLAGKILRVSDNGEIPTDNPYGNEVYSYGHRNPQGLAWDNQGRLWETEHGRSGIQSGLDEINLIVKGGNYGWPLIEGNKTKDGMIAPVIQSGAEVTWAPADIVYQNGKLYFTGLKGQSLYEATVTSDGKLENLKTYFENTYGRLRALSIGPNGDLFMSTSNTDGRGKVLPEDDKIIRLTKGSVNSILGCYQYKNNNSVYSLNVKEVDGETVRGTLSFDNFQMDSTSGSFQGRYEGNKLNGVYSFASEGSDSKTEQSFERDGENFKRKLENGEQLFIKTTDTCAS